MIIFVSYGHVDNKEGWVTFLVNTLDLRLRTLIPIHKPKVWLDIEKLGENPLEMDDELRVAIAKATHFMPVISPVYANSEYCKLEKALFLSKADISRFFPVEKHPVKDSISRTFFTEKKRKVYDMHQEISEWNKNKREFDHTITEERQAFRKSIWNLADDISDQINIDHEPKIVAFMAPSTSEVFDDVDFLRSHFFAKKVRFKQDDFAWLRQDSFTENGEFEIPIEEPFVYLLGSKYGEIIGKGPHSREEWLFRKGVEQNKRQFVWISPDAYQDIDPQQQRFLTFLKTDPEAQANAEIIHQPLEKFIESLEKELGVDTKPESKQLMVILHLNEEMDTIIKISDQIFVEGIEPRMIEYPTGADAKLWTGRKRALYNATSFLIIHTSGNEETTLEMIDSIKEKRGEVPIFVYNTQPTNNLKTHYAQIISGSIPFAPTDLAPILDHIKRENG